MDKSRKGQGMKNRKIQLGFIARRKRLQDKNTLALLRPTNLRGNAWKDLLTRIMKITLQEKG